MRKIQKRESELIKSVSVALRFIRSSRGLGHFPQQAKMRRVYTGALLANLQKMKGRTLFMRNLEKEQRLGRNGIENLCIKPTFNYCTGEEQFTFFKLPKCLIDDACFLGLSIDAKLLYAIFLDRVSLSIKNGWVDENGRVFIYYSVINICEILNCGTQKACKLLDELETFVALERRRQGLGKPNKLYLKKVF